MINFIMSGQDFSLNVGSFQASTTEITGSNGFTTASGKEVKNITGYKMSLKMQLSQLSTEELASVITILGNKNIAVQSDFPNADGLYEMDGGHTTNNTYNDRKKAEWSIDFTLSRNIAANGDGL